MAFVETYEVGFKQLDGEFAHLLWHLHGVRENVKDAECVVVAHSKNLGAVIALYASTELACWKYVTQNLCLDLEYGQYYTAYEIWYINSRPLIDKSVMDALVA